MRLDKNTTNIEPPKFLLVHPDMSVGGAERQIVEFLKHYDRDRLDIVLVLYEEAGRLLPEVKNVRDVKLVSLPNKRSFFGLGRLVGLARVVFSEKPDGMYSFLANVNVASYIVGRLLRIKVIVWGLRVSKFGQNTFGIKGRILEKMAVQFSCDVDLIVANNESGLKEYQKAGFSPRKSVIVKNGIDIERFKADCELRQSFREEIGAKKDDVVICKVARIVEWKGYHFFIRAISEFEKISNKLIFICVGTGDRSLIERYQTEMKHASPNARVLWLGDRFDVERILNGCDIFTLVSLEGEGFSNAIGEAMAVSKPIVATNVGDSAEVVGEAGVIVDPNDSLSIVDAWKTLVADKNLAAQMGRIGRQRVIRFYSVQNSAKLTESALVSCFLKNRSK